MQRGLDLEPIARENFIRSTGIQVMPIVVVKDWAMASLDGMSDDGSCIVEIKCPGSRDHSTALKGKIPDHYQAQLQHQMYVTGLQETFYYSFDGKEGVYFKVKRDDEYIERMVNKEKKFYENLMLRIPIEKEDSE
jgi:putative phage-type endonuclease